MSSKARIWLVGNGGFYNRGCEAIFRGSTQLVNAELENCGYDVWSPVVDEDRAAAPLPNVHWHGNHERGWLWGKASPYRVAFPIARRLPGSAGSLLRSVAGLPDVVLALGGDNFSLDYGLPHLYVNQCKYFLRQGIPTVIWSASVGPFSENEAYEKKMASFLKRVSLITAREDATVDYLASLGVRDNVVRVHDVAFAMDPEPYTGPEVDFVEHGDIVGLNVSALVLKWYQHGDAAQFQEEVAGFVRKVVSSGKRVLLIPHVSLAHGPIITNDHAFLGQLHEKLGDIHEHVTLLPANIPARQLKWLIGKCRFFLGARTHATIAAISSGVPTVAIAYSAKARGIWNDVFGNTDYLLETNALSASALEEKLALIERDEEKIRATLAEQKPVMREGARKNARALAELLEKHRNEKS